MRLPTSDQMLSTPVIGAIGAAIVVLLLLAVLALRAGAADEVDLSGAPAASETAVDDEQPTSDSDPGTTAGTAAPIPDAGAGPSTGSSAAPAPTGTGTPAGAAPAATPTIPLGEPDTGAAAAPSAGGTGASEGAAPADGGDGAAADTPPADGALAAGTCIEDDGRAPDVGSATPVDCAVSHTGEVFATTAVQLPPDAAYPGAEVLDHDTRGLCQGPAFQEYVGTPHDDSALFTYALFPTSESWAAGDRAIACVAFHPMERTEGSVRGSGR